MTLLHLSLSTNFPMFFFYPCLQYALNSLHYLHTLNLPYSPKTYNVVAKIATLHFLPSNFGCVVELVLVADFTVAVAAAGSLGQCLPPMSDNNKGPSSSIQHGSNMQHNTHTQTHIHHLPRFLLLRPCTHVEGKGAHPNKKRTQPCTMPQPQSLFAIPSLLGVAFTDKEKHGKIQAPL